VFARTTTDHDNTIRWVSLQPGDAYADIIYKNGKKRRMEFYYGSTYLSQSTRKIKWDAAIARMAITNFRGIKRTL
jgi:hypothetical protein